MGDRGMKGEPGDKGENVSIDQFSGLSCDCM